LIGGATPSFFFPINGLGFSVQVVAGLTGAFVHPFIWLHFLSNDVFVRGEPILSSNVNRFSFPASFACEERMGLEPHFYKRWRPVRHREELGGKYREKFKGPRSFPPMFWSLTIESKRDPFFFRNQTSPPPCSQ